MSDVINKWDTIYKPLTVDANAITPVLSENVFLLPEQGQALDLACGLGADAIFLAAQGLAVTAWDISGVAIEKLQAYARQQQLQINACRQNITRNSFAEKAFDVIVVSRFLDRSLMDAIISALKPNGLLFYQTFTRQKLTPQSGITRHTPNNPDYLLAENELLQLFSELKLVFYRENGLLGNQESGLRNETQFIGQKRSNSD
ncbi:MAG: methyltransferase domain-containing protein [Methylococcales bacterium]